MTPHLHASALLPLPPSKTIDDACLTCGTFPKTGKVSCCALGGSWFQRCGAAGDSSLGHTWADGIRACNTFEAAAHSAVARARHITRSQDVTQPLNAPRYVTLPRDATDTQPWNVTAPRESVARPQEGDRSHDVTQPQSIDSTTGSASRVGTTDSTGRDELAKLASCLSLSFIVLRLQS